MTPISDARAAALTCAFVHWFGLTNMQARFLVELYARGGEPISPAALSQAAASAPGAVAMNVSLLRRAFDPEAIDYAPGAGYSLTAEGLAECGRALAHLRAELPEAA